MKNLYSKKKSTSIQEKVYLDHGFAEDLNKRLAFEASGSETRRDYPHDPGPQPPQPPVVSRGGGGSRDCGAEQQRMDKFGLTAEGI